MSLKTIFLINPSERHLLENAGDRCPLGVLYLSSFLKEKGYSTYIWDLNHDDADAMMMEAERLNVQHFCITIATPLYQHALCLAQKIRHTFPQAVLIAGGNHLTDNPYEQKTGVYFNYVVVGDGEEGILRILEGKADQQIVYSKPIENLDSLPIPDYEGVDIDKYKMFVDGKPGALIVTSRGCKYNCSYCGSASSLNKVKMKTYRERSPLNVIEEMEILYQKYGKRGFYFGDDIFTKNKARVIELCELIKQKFPGITWRATTRADLLDEELVQVMKSAGCSIICLGIESGNDMILRNIQKGLTTLQNRKGVELCHSVGIKVKGFFIFPLPGDTEETFKETLEFAKSLKLEYCDIYPLTPYPGTQFWNNPEKYGLEIIKPLGSDWDNYYQVGKSGANHELKFKHPNFSQERIIELITRFQKEIALGGLTYG